jgi:hypothetical protein
MRAALPARPPVRAAAVRRAAMVAAATDGSQLDR